MVQRVAVVDYGMGNLHSVAKALEHVGDGVEVVVTDRPELLRDADKLVFPGVGAIRDCMSELKSRGFATVLRELTGERPTLAICVGMQALMAHSEENDGVDCLGILPGRVRRFTSTHDAQGERLKIPHMGWNRVDQRDAHPLWAGIENGQRFYFVHSYYVATEQSDLVSGSCDYGCQFAAAMQRDGLFAVQFHPEKSDRAGLRLLKNFLDWNGK